MLFREAQIEDIPAIQKVRHSVKENTLSDPTKVTDDDCRLYLTVRGKGWVCTADDEVVGFAVADLQDDNIWALFVDPRFEKKGIGRQLHDIMLNWYFEQGKDSVWLSTSPGTRAELFYKTAGWITTGEDKSGELRFELSKDSWRSKSRLDI